MGHERELRGAMGWGAMEGARGGSEGEGEGSAGGRAGTYMGRAGIKAESGGGRRMGVGDRHEPWLSQAATLLV